jgi:pyrroloquinoline quinone biosynthesis protein B
LTQSSNFRALVLGAAAGGGLPQWNCGCENCRQARDPASPVRPQTQSSLAVTGNGRDWAILNASPDIRTQIEACASSARHSGQSDRERARHEW